MARQNRYPRSSPANDNYWKRCYWMPFARFICSYMRKPGERQSFEEVEAWITSADTEYVFSFVNVCTLLGLDAEAVRTHLITWKASRNEASARVSSAPKPQFRIVQR